MHAHSGGRNSAHQPATTPTDNFALLHCTFQQGFPVPPSRRRVCSGVHLQFTAPSELLHAPPLLQPAAAPLGKLALIPHRLTLTSPALYASFPPPEGATLHHSPLLRATPRPGGTAVLQLGSTPRPDAAPFDNSAVLPPDESAPALTVRANLRSSPPLRPQQRHPVYDTQQHRLATQYRQPIRSSATTSLYQLCASLPPPKTAPVH